MPVSLYQGYYIRFQLGHTILKVFIYTNQITFDLHQGLLSEILEELVEELATGSKNSLMSFEMVTYKKREKFLFRVMSSSPTLRNKCRCRRDHPAYKCIPAAYNHLVFLFVIQDTTAADLC